MYALKMKTVANGFDPSRFLKTVVRSVSSPVSVNAFPKSNRASLIESFFLAGIIGSFELRSPFHSDITDL